MEVYNTSTWHSKAINVIHTVTKCKKIHSPIYPRR
uniref:Uncharacterized protein n=1 Tax=Arundo donax TaxID=35708 RepID=A0A0A9D1J2_ARUDO